MSKNISIKQKNSFKTTKNQCNRFKYYSESTSGRYRGFSDDTPPKTLAPPPPAPSQETKFNSKLLPFDSTVDLSDQTLDIIKFDKQIFRSNFILREFLRNSQTTVNYSKNFPIYENLCRGCGYGLFDAKGNLCKFCQYVIDGYIKDYSRNLIVGKNESDKSSQSIYENLCENCGKIVIDGVCPTCSKLKSKTDCKPIKSKRFFHGIIDTLKRTKSKNSSDQTLNEISKKKEGEKSSLSSLLSFSVSQAGQKPTTDRKIEIIHNVDGYDNVFKTQDTFDLKKICELKNSNIKELSKKEESPYGKIKQSDLSLDSTKPRTLLRNGKLFKSNKDNIKRSKSSSILNEKLNSKKTDRNNKTLEYQQNKRIKLETDVESNYFNEVFPLIKIPSNTLEWMSSIKITTVDYQYITDDSINSNKNIPSRNYCDCCNGNIHVKINAANLLDLSQNSIAFINSSVSKNSSISSDKFMEIINSEENNLTEPSNYTIKNLPVSYSQFYDSEIKLNDLILQVNECNIEYNNNNNIEELQCMIEEFKRNLIVKQHNRNLNKIEILHEENVNIKREEYCELREIEVYKESSRSKRKAIYMYDQHYQSDNNNLNEILLYNNNSNEYLVNENNYNEINPQFNLKLFKNGSDILRIKNNNNCTENLLVEQSKINNNNENRNSVCEKSSSDSEFVRDLLATFDKFLKKDYYTINDVNESDLKNPDIDNNKNLTTIKESNDCYYQDFENLLKNVNYNYYAPTLSNNKYFVNKVKNPIIEQINLKNLIISVTLSKCLNKIIISYDKNLYIFLKFIQNTQVHSKWNFDKLFIYYKKFIDLCEQKRKLNIMKKEILPNNFIKLNENNIEAICNSYISNNNNNKVLKLNMDINNENNNNNNYENINKGNKTLQHDNIYENVEQNLVYENCNLKEISKNEKEQLFKLGNSSLPIFETKFKPIVLARSISESTIIKSNSSKSLLPPVPPVRQNSFLSTKQEVQCNPTIIISRNSGKESEEITRVSKPKVSNRYGKIFQQLEEEEDSDYGTISQTNTQNDQTYGKIKNEENSYGKLKPIPAPRKLSESDTKTEVYANILVTERKYVISRKAPAPPLRTSSTKLSKSQEILNESNQLEQNIYSLPNKEQKNQIQNNDDGIYQPIWQFKTVGNPRESYQSSCFNSDITESANESSYNDYNEWETDDEFMFSTKTPKNKHESNNNIKIIDNNNFNEKPKIVVLDDNISEISSVSTTSTITGDIKNAGAINTGYQIINKNSIKNNSFVNINPYRIVCILYSPFNQKLRAFIHDYQNILNNSVNELFKSSSQLSLTSLKTNNNDSDIISITSQTSSTKSIASNSESSPPLPAPCRKISGKRKPNNSPRLANKLFIPDSVHAWKFMLLDVNYCDDEEDLYISEDEILKLKEIEHIPINAPLQRFKSASSDNLLDIPAQDKKSIGERFRNKLQRGVLKLNPKQIKETKKGKQSFRPIERSSLYLDDGIKPKYPIFNATLDDVEKDTCDCNVPRFIVVCITLIQQKDLITIDGIYRASGNKVIIDDVKKKLTQSYIFDSQLIKNEDIHTITGLLKLFFRELKTPLIPQEFYHQLPDNLVKVESLAEIKKILNEIPQPNKGTLKYLLKHLTVVAHYSSENRMPASNLAIIWGPCILYADTSGPFDIARMNTLTKILIENYDFIFGDDERLVM